MAFNGYRNFETWKFMLYFEDYLCEYLQEQQKYNETTLNYNYIYNTVKHIINEMYEGADKNVIGSMFLSDVISDFLVEIDIEEVTNNIAHTLGVSE